MATERLRRARADVVIKDFILSLLRVARAGAADNLTFGHSLKYSWGKKNPLLVDKSQIYHLKTKPQVMQWS
jgi:hypothetical protein